MGVVQRIRKAFKNGPRVTREDFVEQLQRFVDHKEGDWDWDDFMSLKVADAELEVMRLEICKRGVPPDVPQQAYEYMRECIAKLRNEMATTND